MNSPVKILVLSTYDDKQFIFGLLGNGAAGYLTKEEVPETIVEAVRGVARGEKGWVSRRVAAIMSAWTQTDDISSKNLTPRELDVLKWVVKGKTNQEIARQLIVATGTVKAHAASIYRKLDYETLTNHSVVQTLSRSINTQLMTVDFLLLALALFGDQCLEFLSHIGPVLK